VTRTTYARIRAVLGLLLTLFVIAVMCRLTASLGGR
jgi:hypothetical protein